MRSIDADAIYDTLSDIFIEYLATSSNTDTRNALDSLYHTVLSAVETAPTVSPDEVLGVGMCLCLVWEQIVWGTLVGLLGIIMLIALIPMIKGIK